MSSKLFCSYHSIATMRLVNTTSALCEGYISEELCQHAYSTSPVMQIYTNLHLRIARGLYQGCTPLISVTKGNIFIKSLQRILLYGIRINLFHKSETCMLLYYSLALLYSRGLLLCSWNHVLSPAATHISSTMFCAIVTVNYIMNMEHARVWRTGAEGVFQGARTWEINMLLLSAYILLKVDLSC